ncbi:uncharacterized protein RB166_000220 [Leptodactylus fuscus]
MERDRNKMAESLLNLTLEIIYQLTGEDYTVVKKTSSGRCQAPVYDGYGGNLSPIPGSPPHSLIQEEINGQKILELTNKMLELLTGEVPIRCQDVAVYFSMEEWEYLEGHKDLYKEVMMEDHQPLTSAGRSSKRTTLERCPSPLLPQDDDQRENSRKTAGNETRGSETYSRRSSAYSAALTIREPNCIPWTSGQRRNATARFSITKAKSKGERGQPWRVPLRTGKKSEITPFTRIRADAFP